MGKRIVIALGGNALGNNAEEQIELVKQTAQTIVDMAEEGYEVIVGHGNGPQVGMINLAMEFAANNGGGTPAMPFPECGAMSQGYIGYHLQQAIQNELRKRKLSKHCASVVTQMIVDEKDPAFDKPTKPIGLFYTEEESVKLAAEKGYSFMEDAGRGYRRVVASPLPKEIVEIDLIKQLTGQGDIVITVGGGGIPVIETAEGYKGVAAVIDKDRSCSKLALDLNADMLIILTAVDRVCIHYNTPQQEELATMNVAEAKQYIKEGHFAPGSMLPKIEACLDFVEQASEGQALVTSLVRAKDALAGVTGTIIKK